MSSNKKIQFILTYKQIKESQSVQSEIEGFISRLRDVGMMTELKRIENVEEEEEEEEEEDMLMKGGGSSDSTFPYNVLEDAARYLKIDRINIMDRLFKKKGEEVEEISSELKGEDTLSPSSSLLIDGVEYAGEEIGSYELTVWKESEEDRLFYWYKKVNEEKGVKELKEMLNRLEKEK